MNDFTKEELELLKKCIWLADAANGACRVEKVQELEIKVQSMIDNHCEHESSEPRLVLVKNCVKCNCHLETRPWGSE